MSRAKATTEDLVAAYDRAGRKERKFVRELVNAGYGEPEARIFLELLHYFPGAHFTPGGIRGEAIQPPSRESQTPPPAESAIA